MCYWDWNRETDELTPGDVGNHLKWFGEGSDRCIARDDRGPITVSTMFLCLDHSHGWGGSPVLFESMVFGGPFDQEQRRYATASEARKGHAEICELAFDDPIVRGEWGDKARSEARASGFLESLARLDEFAGRWEPK